MIMEGARKKEELQYSTNHGKEGDVDWSNSSYESAGLSGDDGRCCGDGNVNADVLLR